MALGLSDSIRELSTKKHLIQLPPKLTETEIHFHLTSV